MATFGITPVQGYPLPPQENFPQFIQFQSAGADLGGPDVDTVNVSTGLTATRGTGENSNTVTLVGNGGGGGSQQVLAFQLTGSGGTGGFTINNWSTNSLVASTDVTWDSGAKTLTFAAIGVFEVEVSTFVSGLDNVPSAFSLRSVLGSGDSLVTGSSHYTSSSASYSTLTYTDAFIVNATNGNLVRDFNVQILTGESSLTFDVAVDVIVRRLSPSA